MGYAGFKAHKAETQAIIDAHKYDFDSSNAAVFLKAAGGYKKYLKSLGGVFAKYADFTGRIQTYEQLAEIGDYVWGLYDIWGVDYSNGCSYSYGENIYRAYSKDGSQFYKAETPKERFQCNYAAFSFRNGQDLPGIDEMLGNPGRYFAVTNCGQGPLQVLKKAGLVSLDMPSGTDYPETWKQKGYNYKLIKKTSDLQPGDLIYCFKNKIKNRDSISALKNWESGAYHTCMVGERDDKAGTVTLYDSGHAYTHYGQFRNVRKLSESNPYQWAADWIGIRYDFGLKKEDKMDIERYTDLQLASMVWEGKFGKGDERKKALGERYESVQNLVEIGKDRIKSILNKKTEAEQLAALAEALVGMDGTLPWKLAGYKDEWCSEFVWYCAKCLGFIQRGLMPAADTCPKAHEFYNARGLLHTKKEYAPKPGDVAYFGENGTMHTAIVKSFDGKTLTTVDGNQGGNYLTSKVGICRANINGSWPWGFANPLTIMNAKTGLYFKAEKMGAYLRKTPCGEIIVLIPKGGKAEILGFTGRHEKDGYEWAYVKYGQHCGFVQLDLYNAYSIEQ